MGCLKIVWLVYNFMVGLFGHKIRTQSLYYSYSLSELQPTPMSLFPWPDYIWIETSWKYKVTGLRSATADVSIIGHLSCQSVLEQKTRTLPVCLIQVLWSEISAKVVKCYWLDSSCSLLLSSRAVCFLFFFFYFFLSSHRQGRTKALGWRFCRFLNWI